MSVYAAACPDKDVEAGCQEDQTSAESEDRQPPSYAKLFFYLAIVLYLLCLMAAVSSLLAATTTFSKLGIQMAALVWWELFGLYPWNVTMAEHLVATSRLMVELEDYKRLRDGRLTPGEDDCGSNAMVEMMTTTATNPSESDSIEKQTNSARR
jgi:hypothetical protein